MIGQVLEASPLPAAVGELCRIAPEGRAPVLAQTVGFHDRGILLMPLGEIEGKSGKPLMVDDAAGMKTLYSKVEALVKEMGLEQGDAKKESMVLEAEYEIQKLQEEVAKNKA